MYLKLPPNYEDPATGMPMPDAVLVILDAQFSLRGPAPVLQARVYANVVTYGSAREPVWEGPLPLSQAETAAQQPALLAACYGALAQRPEYEGATVITP